MSAAYLKIATMLITIALGYFLHQIGIFTKEDSQSILKILMYITLPCVVIKSLNGMTITRDLLTACLLGIIINSIFFALAFLFSKKTDPEDRAVKIFAFSSFNTGTYVLPFLSGIASSYSIAGVLAFAYPGTAAYTYGIAPAVASMVLNGQNTGQSPLKTLWIKLTRNVAFDFCVVMLILCLLGISLPDEITAICSTIGGTSSTLAMISIGILMDFHLPRKEFIADVGIILIRLCASILCALAVLYVIPMDTEISHAVALTLFAPAASYNTVIAMHCGYKGSRIAMISSLQMIVSLITTTIVSGLLF